MTMYSAELLIPSCLFSVLRDKLENKGKRAECVKSVWRSKREERLGYEGLYFLARFKFFMQKSEILKYCDNIYHWVEKINNPE